MHHLTREKTAVHRLFDRARTIAIVGASPRGDRHSNTVCSYLHHAGYDVVPVRPDLQDVCGLKAFAALDEIPGRVDVAIIYRRSDAAAPHFEEAVRKGVEAVWLPPGVATPALEKAARQAGVHWLIRDRCPAEEFRQFMESGGAPRRFGVHLRRSKATFEDQRKHPEDAGYVPSGGGGRAGGGGVRAVLDEKKMVAGRPSRRHGRTKTRPF